jgi:hypothetical protein
VQPKHIVTEKQDKNEVAYTGVCGSVVVEEICYKLEDGGFDTR